jgi:hypothetical protein
VSVRGVSLLKVVVCLGMGTLSPTLHTSPLPVTHGRIGNWWQNTRFVLDFVQLNSYLLNFVSHTLYYNKRKTIAMPGE